MGDQCRFVRYGSPPGHAGEVLDQCRLVRYGASPTQSRVTDFEGGHWQWDAGAQCRSVRYGEPTAPVLHGTTATTPTFYTRDFSPSHSTIEHLHGADELRGQRFVRPRASMRETQHTPLAVNHDPPALASHCFVPDKPALAIRKPREGEP